MTRRITLAILLSVWAMMLAAGLTAYFATRSVLLEELDGRLVARAAALPEVSGMSGTAPDPEDRYLVRTGSGQVVRRVEPNAAGAKPTIVSAQFARLGDGQSYRSVTVRFEKPSANTAASATAGGDMTVVYSGPADSFDRVLRRLAMALVAFGIVGGVAAAAIAAAASRTAMRPLGEVAQVVGEIDDRNLSRRVDTEKLPPELQPIGQRLNGMLGRLEENFLQRRQFLADASHELRTPVAALVTTLEVNLTRRQHEVPVMRRAMEDCLSDARLLRGLVERLTAQVRGEMAERPGEVGECDLSALIRTCLTVAEGLAIDLQVEVRADLPESLWIRTRRDRLQRVLLNLMSNGIAYNKPGGELVVTCEAVGDGVRIEVRDTGIGIAPDDLAHVFSLFYRADAARDTAGGHLGLGLYQVQGDVASMNGTCQIASTPGQGTTVTVLLNACVIASPDPAEADSDPVPASGKV
ncbi:MAG: heavy metal sensor signal transduction histidine kinase [Phycisphaerales bacterium]|nr:heavy metal sensor signal transduction histidine kinase [Phycisphaerales bacterium]